MSAFLSIARPDGVALLTDGAAAERGILRADVRKVVIGDGIAVTGRGPAEAVFGVAESICKFADAHGPEAAIAAAQEFAWQAQDCDGSFEILIAASLPGVGGVHRFFQSTATTVRQTGEDVAAFQVWNPGVIVNSIGRLTADQVAPFHPRYGSLDTAARRDGLAVMGWMRGIPTEGGLWAIGGHVDLTLITVDGVTVECIHEYGDAIGEPIVPLRQAA